MTAARQKPNFLERTIAAIAPSYALQRASAKERLIQFGYDAATPGNRRGHSGGQAKNGSPETWRMSRDREEIMWEMRDLDRNSAIVSGILNRIAQYAVQRLEYNPSTGDKKLDREYSEYFHDWCGRADITGRFRLRELAKLAIRSWFRDGDCGFIESKKLGELRLQPIEADRIGSRDPVNDNKRMGGVVVGDAGEPTGYRIYNRSVTNQYSLSHEEDAKNFIHIFEPTRMDQYRGISPFAPVSTHIRDIYEMIGYEKIAAKWQGSIAGFKMRKGNEDGIPTGWDTQATTTEPASWEIQPGRIQEITEGTSIEFANGAQRPSGSFLAFHETIIRLISMGLNLPYGFVWDMAGFGGASSRIEVMQAWRRIQEIQQMLEDRMLNRVKDKVLMLGIATGKIKPTKNWNKGSFRFGTWLTADAGYQVSNEIQLITAGLKSRQQYHTEYGTDFLETQSDIYGEIETQAELSSEKKIPLEMIPGSNPMASQLLASANQADLPADELQQPEPPGLMGTFGDKGAKQLLEINKQVADGTLLRESAVMQVAALFGVTPQEADILVGQPSLTKPKPKE